MTKSLAEFYSRTFREIAHVAPLEIQIGFQEV